jgi:hypothetical protein
MPEVAILHWYSVDGNSWGTLEKWDGAQYRLPRVLTCLLQLQGIVLRVDLIREIQIQIQTALRLTVIPLAQVTPHSVTMLCCHWLLIWWGIRTDRQTDRQAEKPIERCTDRHSNNEITLYMILTSITDINTNTALSNSYWIQLRC